jgi:hypothetical protein
MPNASRQAENILSVELHMSMHTPLIPAQAGIQ